MPREDLRKLVHIGFSLGAFLVPWLGRGGGLAMALVGLAHNLWLLPRHAFGQRLYREGPVTGRTGIIAYPLVVAVLFAVAPVAIAAATWVIIGFGDGFATIVGRRARHRLPWNARKTWAGSIAFVIMASLAAFAVLELTWPGLPRERAVLIALLGSATGALVETLPWRLDDNISVAVAAAAVMWIA